MIRFLLLLTAISALEAGEWSAPVEVRQDEKLCLSYRARLDGPYLVIEAAIEPGWHTFAMDNKQRVDEKLAGRRSLGMDRPTEITISGLTVTGPWLQTPPKDFSKPEIRWYSFGFEQQARFAAPVQSPPSGSANIVIRGQACTDTTCKNIETSLALPVDSKANSKPTASDLKSLIPVR